MKRKLTLSSLNLILVFGSLLIFIAILTLLLQFGLVGILNSWHEQETASLSQYVSSHLSEEYARAQKNGATLDSEALTALFSGLPFSPSYLIITDASGNTLYSYRKADRGMGRGWGMMQNMQVPSTWEEVKDGSGNAIFLYASYIAPFAEQASNQHLLSAAKLLLVWGFVIALGLSIVMAFFFSRNLKRQSGRLSSALQKMALGARDVQLTEPSVQEFTIISEAAITLQTNLKKEESLRSQWAEDIAHDLRTPVAVLKGQLEAIGDGVFSADEKHLGILTKETVRLEQLINSLSLLTRLENPGFKVEKSELDLAAFLNSLAQRFSVEASRKNMPIVINAASKRILADSLLLDRLLANLLANSIHYGKSGHPIQMYVTNDDEGIPSSLTIENSGTIPPNVLPYIFDRLYRGEQARSSEGSGLGLSIAKAIAEAHHWTIRAESDENTRIIIDFT